MSRTLRIRHRLLALTLLPAVAVGLALTFYWSVIKVQEIESLLMTRGNTIVGFLAPAAEYGVISGNRAFLRSASMRVRDEPDLVSIRISDQHGNLLYTYVQDLQPSGHLSDLSRILFGHGIRHFDQPILLSSLDGFERIATFGDTPDNEPQRVIGHVDVTLSTIPTAIAQTEWILRSMVIILVLLGLTAVFVHRLERPLSRPLEEMAETVHRIGRGDLDARVPDYGPDELGVLANGINDMAENIRRAHERMSERIQASTRDLQEQLSLVDEKNRALTIARAQAEEANHKKSRLLASISHELRTPLSAIQGYTELLMQDADLDEQKASWLGIINGSSRDTLKLVNDLLDVARLESGRISLHRTQFDLEQCLSEVIGICRRSSYGSKMDVTLVMDPETPTCITSDNLRFKQVITNILSNALKFTGDGHVSIRTGLRNSEGRRHLELCVRDNGPGIDPDDLPHIFEPFFQSRQPDSRRQSGAGLGLSITRSIVSLLGGQILVDSAPGAGSLFTVLLPVAESDVPLPTSVLPGDVVSAMVWSDDPELRRILLEILRVMRLPGHACGDVDEYLKHLGNHPRSVGIIWMHGLSAEEMQRLNEHTVEIARTLVARSARLGERITADLAAHGARLIPLTLSVHALNRAIHGISRSGKPDPQQAGPTVSDTAQGRLAGMSFLVADDNAVNRRLLTEFVQRNGGRVIQAEDGDSAVRAYSSDPPDLVFMDVHMPGKDGIAALDDIRASDATARIVAVTADLRPETHIALLQHGFDHVLYKPVSETDLLACVENAPSTSVRACRRSPSPFDTPQPLHDENIALQRAGGNARLARDMLQMLIKDVGQVRAQLDEPGLGSGALIEMVHRVHGGARYCGTLRLAACSQALEMALKGGQAKRAAKLKSAWTAELDALLQSAEALLETLENAATNTI